MSRDKFYEMIFNNYLDIIKRVVKCTICSESLADIEDCVQNVIVAALQKQDLQEHPNVEGWLYITGRNIAMQFNSEYLKRKNFLDIDNDENEYEPYEESFLNQLIEDIEFERLKEQDFLRNIHKSLSKSERHFFDLRYIKKYSNTQISAITGKSEGAIRVRYSRLKEKIEKIIKNM